MFTLVLHPLVGPDVPLVMSVPAESSSTRLTTVTELSRVDLHVNTQRLSCAQLSTTSFASN